MHLPSTDLLQLVAIWRLFLAGLFGTILGLERSLAGKHAGMRTYALVSMGSCLFVLAGILQQYSYWGSSLDPSRIAASVVMGIGFIGSGLIFLRADNSINSAGELTTAAGIWVAAGVGIAVGMGFYLLSLAAVIFSLVILVFLMAYERRARGSYNAIHPEKRLEK